MVIRVIKYLKYIRVFLQFTYFQNDFHDNILNVHHLKNCVKQKCLNKHLYFIVFISIICIKVCNI